MAKRIKGHKYGSSLSSTPEYKSFQNMMTRCYNPNVKNYHRWGGRGIRVCERWLEEDGFRNFLNDMGKKPTSRHQLDRIDNDGDYTPENCRWATQKEQMNNTTRSARVDYGGQEWAIPDLARKLKIKEATLRARIAKGLPKRMWAVQGRVSWVSTDRVRKNERIIEFNGQTKTLAQWEEITGIPRYTISYRISRYGWSVGDALTVPVKNGGVRKSRKQQFSTEIVNKLIDYK